MRRARSSNKHHQETPKATSSYSSLPPPNISPREPFSTPLQHWPQLQIAAHLQLGTHHQGYRIASANSVQLPQRFNPDCNPPTGIYHPSHSYYAPNPFPYCGACLAWFLVQTKVRDVGCPGHGRRPTRVECPQDRTQWRCSLCHSCTQQIRPERTGTLLVCLVEERSDCSIQ